VLREPHERPGAFGRGDAARFVLAVIPLVIALAAGVAGDLTRVSPGYATGAVAGTAIDAPRDASIPNDIETQAAKDAAAAAVPLQYDFTPAGAASIAAAQLSKLKTALQPIDDAMASSDSATARRDALTAATSSALPSLSVTERALLLDLDSSRWPTVKAAAETALTGGEAVEIRESNLATKQLSLAFQYLPAGLSASEVQLAEAIATPLYVVNSRYSSVLTAQAQAQAVADQGTIYDTVKAGQVIVDQGHIITAAEMVQIRYFGLDQSGLDWGAAAAWMLLGTVVAGLMLGWLWRFRPEYWARTRTLVLIGLIFILSVLAVKLLGGRTWLPYLVPVAAAGMVLTLLLDAGVGIVTVALLAVLAGPVTGSSTEMSAYVFLGGLAGILAIRKGERQHFFVEAGLAVAAAQIVVIGTFALMGLHDMTGTLQLWGAAAAGALVATVITLGSFSLLGNLFGILTGSQLLELANPSQPLLRRLLTETPGTYHHSLMVGNLGERAASAVGADPLLVRAAAYYHDIGKLANPIAFIENQAAGDNLHDQLDPAASATILKQHVADGIDLANKARLPKPLIAFIPQHHGTAILGYVYGKAREQAAQPFGGEKTAAGKAAADAVDQRRFRHGGPKPQSREAAILMLSDGVEASVRSLSSRDEATIRAMVSQIIQERLGDGQLSECDLTIRDLERIHEAFVGQLLGMYHQRIAYPQNKVVELESRRERGLR
jgi:cyclic-di-AMP phosphodiesterase PgpH